MSNVAAVNPGNRQRLAVRADDRHAARIIPDSCANELRAVRHAGLRLDDQPQALSVAVHVEQPHAAGRVKVAFLHRVDDRRSIQASGPHHDPAPARIGFVGIVGMVVMRIVHRDGIDDIGRVPGQSLGENDVPHALDADMFRITQIAHGGMAVVDFEKVFPANPNDVFGGERPAKIGMIDVREHRQPSNHALGQHGVHVPLNHIHDAGPYLRLDEIAQIRRVEVDRRFFKLVGDFLALDHEKATRLLE